MASEQKKPKGRSEPRSVIGKGGYQAGSKPIEAFRPPPKGPGVGGAVRSKRD